MLNVVDEFTQQCLSIRLPRKLGLAKSVIWHCTTRERSRPLTGSRYVFFGFATDTSLAAYLFAVIDRAIRTRPL